MFDLIATAIPFFFAMVLIEALAWRFDDDHDAAQGYEAKDSVTSITMGLVNVAINVFWKVVLVAVFAALYELTPIRMPMDTVWAWILLIVLQDLGFYWSHRSGHEVRLLWASHVVHHSSQRFNFSTALRQEWGMFYELLFFAPLAMLGFPPWAIILALSISLVYQFLLHTEIVDRLPRPIEYVFNTPSHHRVHHGSNHGYLDRNYGGMLIIWDRIFGTFRGEDERVVYGLTKNIDTYNPLRVATHELAALRDDIRSAPDLRTKIGYALHKPGWKPAGDSGARQSSSVDIT